MTTALTKFSSDDLQALRDLAELLAASRYFKEASDKAKAAVKILYGRELGLGPIQALLGVDFNEKAGTLSLRAHTMASLIKNSGRYDYRVTKGPDKDGCEITFYEIRLDTAGKELVKIGASFFGPEDAKRAGLSGKDTYQKHTYDMYYNRAMAKGARMHTPDVFGAPAYVEGEVEAAIENAKTVDAVVSSVPLSPPEEKLATLEKGIKSTATVTPESLGIKESDLPEGLQSPGWLEREPETDEISQAVNAPGSSLENTATAEERATAQEILAASAKIADDKAQALSPEAELLHEIAARELAKRIAALAPGATLPNEDANAFNEYLADFLGGGDQGKKAARAAWEKVGVVVKKGATVTREQAIQLATNILTNKE